MKMITHSSDAEAYDGTLHFTKHNIGAYLIKAGFDEVGYSSPAAFLMLEGRQNFNLDKMV